MHALTSHPSRIRALAELTMMELSNVTNPTMPSLLKGVYTSTLFLAAIVVKGNHTSFDFACRAIDSSTVITTGSTLHLVASIQILGLLEMISRRLSNWATDVIEFPSTSPPPKLLEEFTAELPNQDFSTGTADSSLASSTMAASSSQSFLVAWILSPDVGVQD
ncbi:hypothetical protein E2P81_ATG06399 [Venturia nashicola]|nr:hypothetical protein E2P81_ATG06399 [Venturia nashicola]